MLIGDPIPPPIAHVDYVTDPEASADPIGFLLDALASPGAVPLLLAGAMATLCLVLAWARWRPLEPARAAVGSPPPPRTVTFDESDDLDVPDFLK